MAKAVEVRKGTPDPRLTESEFKRRFRTQFTDAAFEPLAGEIERIASAAWDAYAHGRTSAHRCGKLPRSQVVLQDFNLVGWPKTFGSRGMHVYVRRWSFEEVRRGALAHAGRRNRAWRPRDHDFAVDHAVARQMLGSL